MATGMGNRLVWAVVVALLVCLINHSVATGGESTLSLPGALAGVGLFSALTDAERSALAAGATLRPGSAGERIIEQGKTMDRMFIILDGKAEVWVNGKQIATLAGQPLVGEVEFLDGLPACADVRLSKATHLIALNCAALNDLMEKQPRIGYVLMREVAAIEAQRLRKTTLK